MYYVNVRPCNNSNEKTYLFESQCGLDVGDLCRCETKYGDMLGEVVSCCWYSNNNRKELETLIETIAPQIEFPLRRVKSYFSEYKIESEDEK